MADEQRRVEPGDNLFSVARAHGFRTVRPLVEAPGNKALLKQRVNPATLAVGDVVTIPAFEPKAAQAGTERFTRFTVNESDFLLNLVLQDTERRPLAKRSFRLVLAEFDRAGRLSVLPPVEDVTSPKGEISQPITPFTTEGELVVRTTEDPGSAPVARVKLQIGVLEAANTIRGQQVRLNNMGYFAGFSERDLDQLRWAIEEFQADHGVPVTGRVDDPKTFNRIAHEHGDLLPNEQVP